MGKEEERQRETGETHRMDIERGEEKEKTGKEDKGEIERKGIKTEEERQREIGDTHEGKEKRKGERERKTREIRTGR